MSIELTTASSTTLSGIRTALRCFEDIPLFPTLIYDGNVQDTQFLNGDIPSNWKASNTDITQLYIGNSATSIGDYAFSGCSYLTGDIVIPNSVTSIGSNAFRYCTGFTGNLIIGTGVTSIGSYAFYDTYFTRTIIADGRTTIHDNFADNALLRGELTIPNSVTSIGQYAFANFSLSLANSFDGELVLPNSVVTIESYAFYNNNFTGSLTIPNSVTSIGDFAFNKCSGFTGNLTIPNSVTTIGSDAFRDCFGLTSAYLNQPIGSIGSYAFYNSGITNIYIGPDATGYTLGSGQTIGGKSGITVSAWTNYPNVP
jgi:hypothetical protein